jgi:uncharacterized DUF497 family protein
MEFEWDDAKRQSNLLKHGIDFADAEAFDWEDSIRRTDMRRDYGEVRFIALGLFRGRVHSASFTLRNSVYRMISFHKANDRETRLYEKEKEDRSSGL